MANYMVHSAAAPSISNTVVPVSVNFTRKDINIKLQTKHEIDPGPQGCTGVEEGTLLTLMKRKQKDEG